MYSGVKSNNDEWVREGAKKPQPSSQIKQILIVTNKNTIWAGDFI